MAFTVEKTPTRALWLKARNTGIGGSDAPVILGHSPWKSDYELFLEKSGEKAAPDISDNPKVKAGTVSEPLIRQMFAENHPELDVIAGNDLFGAAPDEVVTLRSVEHPFMLGDLDAVAVDAEGASHIVEIKTAHMPSAAQWTDDVPEHYMDQVDHYLALTGFAGAYVVVWIDGWDYREYYVSANKERIHSLIEAETAFWDAIRTGSAPAPKTTSDLAWAHPDPSKEMLEFEGDELAGVVSLIETYVGAKEAAEGAKRAQDEAARALEAMIGDAKGIRTPVGSVTWIRRKAKVVDRKAMEAAAPEIVGTYHALEEAHTTRVIQNGGIRFNPAKEKTGD